MVLNILMSTNVEITPREYGVLRDLHVIMRDARGSHQALADVRAQTAKVIDVTCANLASHGIDIEAVLDRIEAELDDE